MRRIAVLYQLQNETARRRVLTLREITLHLVERPRCSYLESVLPSCSAAAVTVAVAVRVDKQSDVPRAQ